MRWLSRAGAGSLVLLMITASCTPEGGATPRTRLPAPGDAGTPIPGVDGGPPLPRADSGPRPDPRPGDRDADGLPDDDETARGTDPDNGDTDGDGVGDGVEVLAGTDPRDPSSVIPPTDFYVVLPYGDPAEVRELEFRARLGKGDVFFLVDTTGSMGLAINNVRSSLSSTIVPAIGDAIADVVMGVGDYRDFPVDPYGSPGDWPFEVRQAMTTDASAVQTALNGLRAGGGNDGPESMLEGLNGAVSGSCPSGGGVGRACFRSDSHPIIVVVTDAPTHNGPGGSNAYSGLSAVNWGDTMRALNGASIKTVGAAVDSAPIPFPIPIPSGARGDLEALARDTSSRSATGGLTVYDSPGGTVSGAIVDGIVDLVGAETQDVTSRSIDDPTDAVDATRFIKAIRPARATRATRFDETTFYGVAGGTAITFEVTFQNDFLPEETFVQIFQAEIEVHDLPARTRLDIRNVYIVVPAIGGTLI